METKEFNLSEKIDKTTLLQFENVILVKDIKEFIRLLKDEYWKIQANKGCLTFQQFLTLIDKLAGNKLI